MSFISACFAALTASALPGAAVIADAAIANAASALAAPRATSPSAFVPSSSAPSSVVAARARAARARGLARVREPAPDRAARARVVGDRETIAPSPTRIAIGVVVRVFRRARAALGAPRARRASRGRSRVDDARSRVDARVRGAFCGAFASP